MMNLNPSQIQILREILVELQHAKEICNRIINRSPCPQSPKDVLGAVWKLPESLDVVDDDDEEIVGIQKSPLQGSDVNITTPYEGNPSSEKLYSTRGIADDSLLTVPAKINMIEITVSENSEHLVEYLSSNNVNVMTDQKYEPIEADVVRNLVDDPMVLGNNQVTHALPVINSELVSDNLPQIPTTEFLHESIVASRNSGLSPMLRDSASVNGFVAIVEVPIAWSESVIHGTSEALLPKYSLGDNGYRFVVQRLQPQYTVHPVEERDLSVGVSDRKVCGNLKHMVLFGFAILRSRTDTHRFVAGVEWPLQHSQSTPKEGMSKLGYLILLWDPGLQLQWKPGNAQYTDGMNGSSHHRRCFNTLNASLQSSITQSVLAQGNSTYNVAKLECHTVDSATLPSCWSFCGYEFDLVWVSYYGQFQGISTRADSVLAAAVKQHNLRYFMLQIFWNGSGWYGDGLIAPSTEVQVNICRAGGMPVDIAPITIFMRVLYEWNPGIAYIMVLASFTDITPDQKVIFMLVDRMRLGSLLNWVQIQEWPPPGISHYTDGIIEGVNQFKTCFTALNFCESNQAVYHIQNQVLKVSQIQHNKDNQLTICYATSLVVWTYGYITAMQYGNTYLSSATEVSSVYEIQIAVAATHAILHGYYARTLIFLWLYELQESVPVQDNHIYYVALSDSFALQGSSIMVYVQHELLKNVYVKGCNQLSDSKIMMFSIAYLHSQFGYRDTRTLFLGCSWFFHKGNVAEHLSGSEFYGKHFGLFLRVLPSVAILWGIAWIVGLVVLSYNDRGIPSIVDDIVLSLNIKVLRLLIDKVWVQIDTETLKFLLISVACGNGIMIDNLGSPRKHVHNFFTCKVSGRLDCSRLNGFLLGGSALIFWHWDLGTSILQWWLHNLFSLDQCTGVKQLPQRVQLGDHSQVLHVPTRSAGVPHSLKFSWLIVGLQQIILAARVTWHRMRSYSGLFSGCKSLLNSLWLHVAFYHSIVWDSYTMSIHIEGAVGHLPNFLWRIAWIQGPYNAFFGHIFDP